MAQNSHRCCTLNLNVMATVKLEWHRKTVDQKLIKGEFISQQMATNVAEYPTPNPSLADLDAALDDLRKKAVAALAGGYALTYANNQAEKVLDGIISQLMSYVQNASGGVEAIILKSGMNVRKTPKPVPDPLQVENLDAFPTRSQGEVQLTWDSLDNSPYYQVEQWKEDNAGNGFWDKIATISKPKYTVTGLTTGTVYRFRVAGLGKDDVLGPYSQEATSVAP